MGDGDQLFDHFTRTRAIRRSIIEEGPGRRPARLWPQRPLTDFRPREQFLCHAYRIDMTFAIATHLAYDFAEPTDVLLQIEAAVLPEQQVDAHDLELGPVDYFARVRRPSTAVGERIWLRVDGRLTIDYTAEVDDQPRSQPTWPTLNAVEPHLLPGEVIDYLMPSRYLPFRPVPTFVESEFGALQGGARIAAIRDWVRSHFRYVPGASTAARPRADTLRPARGCLPRLCARAGDRMARASSIPARYASVYAPDVSPPDFHAVAEVFLGGAWHLVDATGMSAPADIAMIGVGRDAADIPFLSSFGSAEFVEQEVSVSRT